ncbi:hypothetical protein GB931_12710 [Modestobacter sp. I12A-02628]|uniref:Uncharacterized protein n=1 Tax=Goekera deserti TaxID=2497753 RepID=A0A7K3WB71_9ACTN|nr:hypothetical protein [Goekera deserti]MPQ98766.1 hypothetical protein [Goekera deserti]NDI49737.1 hypothetical protein [Goekera deserti]NEL53070.1 hypothetical protein [Goekera deserti]
MTLTRSTVLQHAVPAVFAGWFVASVLGQHPDRSYDRVRRLDRTGTGVLIPNWRFFAPNPAVEDQHFLYRLASADLTEHTEWREVFTSAPRQLTHAFWFPGRRTEKAVFDVAAALVNGPEKTAKGATAAAAARDLICDFVRYRLTPEPGYPLFQVLLVRYAGYDHSEDPKYDMVFDYRPVAGDGATAARLRGAA